MSEQDLALKILNALANKPSQRGSELASLLGVDKKTVNRYLSYSLSGKVVQDSGYRWSLTVGSGTVTSSVISPTVPQTEPFRLCRYYLEAIGQDSGEGVSVFASSKYGEPEYAELPSLPVLNQNWPWWNSPGVERVLSKVRADRSNLVAWLGYPVRLREHRTPKWHGYFLEPVLLWAIEFPERLGDVFRFVDDLPAPNFSVLRSMAMGDASAVLEEAARLDEELGLNSPLEDRPEVDELLERLVAIRPDWDWLEEINPESCVSDIPISGLGNAGIYNRAVILPGKRSPYTQGLESELKSLSEKSESEISKTALGNWLSGEFVQTKTVDETLIEVVPMNLEQRAAVQSALDAPHTVVTGPPGTGKSQVVTNLLVNAAWRGMKVLFASKNNKAVDVVEARVNGLGNRPVLLRLGSKEYQAKLAGYLATMLSGQAGEDDQISYDEGLQRHKRLSQQLAALDELQSRALESRNLVDKLESDVENYRDLFGQERFNSINETLIEGSSSAFEAMKLSINAIDTSLMGFFGRLAYKFGRRNRIESLNLAIKNSSEVAAHLMLPMTELADQPAVADLRDWLHELIDRRNAARKVFEYQKTLDLLRITPAFEEIAKQRQELSKLVAENSTKLWQDWVQLAPNRLSAAQRKDVSDYATLLQAITGPDAQSVNPSVKAKARKLQANVSGMFSCWAVTSLSAKGKVPFEPGHFDLIVIDEASQCDIASALPLLYRAKRSVIIGDPMQLRHISAVSRSKDSDLQSKYGLVENRASWMYSVNSLYDLAAGVADPAQIINLRDHHRCHGDIVEFSNQSFYGGKLRVATRYDRLKRPRNKEPGVVWQDVKGRTVRPGGGSAQNLPEAHAVIAALEDLLVDREYKGTVGVVTPFQAQAQLLKSLVSQHPILSSMGSSAGLLIETVHLFQGDERDVMFFSPVISEGVQPGALSFLRSNGNLFNVAITRARGLLHVVGDKTTAMTCGVDYLESFANYVGRLSGEQKVREGIQLPTLSAEYPAVAKPENVSDWERVFYRALFEAGLRPIPQFTVEQYDLDFALVIGDRKLDIEVDGERYHRSWTGELCLRDQLRNQRLIELGWEVKRFWVYEIRDRLPDCVNQIVTWSNQAKH